jgi:hypothetical protein
MREEEGSGKKKKKQEERQEERLERRGYKSEALSKLQIHHLYSNTLHDLNNNLGNIA